MPDITAARPVSGASIETAWGTQVHDLIEGIQSGQATANLSSSSAVDVTVTFPRAYTAPPAVMVCTSGTATYLASAKTITTTSFVCSVFHRDATAATASAVFLWLAVGSAA